MPKDTDLMVGPQFFTFLFTVKTVETSGGPLPLLRPPALMSLSNSNDAFDDCHFRSLPRLLEAQRVWQAFLGITERPFKAL
jgi:hypothetical protein